NKRNPAAAHTRRAGLRLPRKTGGQGMRSEGEDRREGVRRRPPTNKQGRRRTHDNPHLYICGSGLQPRTETIFPLPSRERAGEREQHIPLHRESPLPLPLGEGPGEREQTSPSPPRKPLPLPLGEGPGEREQTSPSPPRKPAPSPLAGEGWGEGETEHFSLF